MIFQANECVLHCAGAGCPPINLTVTTATLRVDSKTLVRLDEKGVDVKKKAAYLKSPPPRMVLYWCAVIWKFERRQAAKPGTARVSLFAVAGLQRTSHFAMEAIKQQDSAATELRNQISDEKIILQSSPVRFIKLELFACYDPF